MLTVLIATRNRAGTLSSALETFEHLHVPPGGWKLVVVDNGSTDDTRAVLQSFETRLPLVHMFEGQSGKNYALNTGLSLIEGDLVVFTDDDTFPDRDWLVQMRLAADAQPSYSIFGGAILPRWEAAPPEWVKWVDRFSTYCLTDPTLGDGPASRGTLFGANLAMRADIFRRGIRFDVSIGPSGANYAMGSESELVRRLQRAGHKAWHVQSARVDHFIEADHLNEAWVLGRAVRFGRGQYRLTREIDSSVARWPLYLAPRIARRGLRLARAWALSDEEQLLRARWDLNMLWGHFVEARAFSPVGDRTKDKSPETSLSA